MTTFKVAFIGTGGRSVAYAKAYAACPDIEVVALADPSVEHRQAMRVKAGLGGPPAEYGDWRVMLSKHGDLAGVVITTPNHLHAEPAVACLERGLAVALEKPLATTQSDCERILAAERMHGGRVLLGFVLRSTPLYARIRDWITSGVIGKVVSIQADELAGVGVTSIMHRSTWRRHAATSGGALLEKCCHDMDLLNWLLSSRPLSLNSYGRCAIFKSDPSLPEFCEGCPRAGRCRYYRKPVFSSHEDQGERTLHEFIRQEDRCIYNIDKDGVDVQSVQLEYEGGAIVNFLMSFNCMGPRASRNFHATGTEGRIWANLHEHKAWLHENVADRTTAFDAVGDGSGHGGGDEVHALTLRRMMADRTYRPECNAVAGYLSTVMCLAADVSRTGGRRVGFDYQPDGRVRLV